jgi:glutathione S-transferase
VHPPDTLGEEKTLKLYMFPVAPNPTRVRLYIAEKVDAGTDFDVEEVPVNLPEKEQHSEDHLKRNPLGKLPVLETDEGIYITESLAIIEYLEELVPEPTMYGSTPLERAQTREFERTIETRVLRPLSEMVHATKSPLGWPPNPGVAAYFGATLPKAFEYVEAKLDDGRPLMMGDRPTIADCTMAAAIQFGKIADILIAPEYKNIHAWDARFRERESAKKVLVL